MVTSLKIYSWQFLSTQYIVTNYYCHVKFISPVSLKFCVIWTTNFYSLKLLNLFISTNFLMVSLKFSLYKIISSGNREKLTSFFLIWVTFIYFSCLMVLGRTSSTILNGSSKIGYPCLVLLFPNESMVPFLQLCLGAKFGSRYSFLFLHMDV
jgi:glycerol uptake facilitator-like aquaporin